jgi:hypothetical protein
MKRLISLPALCLALLVLSAGSGCGDKTSVKVVPVHGKVTVDGQPVTEGNVSLLPASGTESKAGMSAGQIKNGEYVIYTGGKEGAPEGQYKVTVTPPMMPSAGGGPPKTPFNSNYSNASKTPLTLKVPADNYDLKLTK